jgi:nickel/cobalt transporter (NiCoT) family protein
VVVTVAVAVSLLARQWQPPAWLGLTGAWISIAVLSLLGVLNIRSACIAPAGQAAALVGWRSGVFARLLKAASAPMVLAVGMLFALSLDTVSLATLFAIAGTRHGGMAPALGLAMAFIAGMLLTDGINGWWISRLVQRADRAAAVASRTLALAVAAVALLTAGLGVARLSWPGFDAWADGKAAWFGAAVIVLVVASHVLGQHLARRSGAEQELPGRVVGSVVG